LTNNVHRDLPGTPGRLRSWLMVHSHSISWWAGANAGAVGDGLVLSGMINLADAQGQLPLAAVLAPAECACVLRKHLRFRHLAITNRGRA
jgi:hypothetical protein